MKPLSSYKNKKIINVLRFENRSGKRTLDKCTKEKKALLNNLRGNTYLCLILSNLFE